MTTAMGPGDLDLGLEDYRSEAMQRLIDIEDNETHRFSEYEAISTNNMMRAAKKYRSNVDEDWVKIGRLWQRGRHTLQIVIGAYTTATVLAVQEAVIMMLISPGTLAAGLAFATAVVGGVVTICAAAAVIEFSIIKHYRYRRIESTTA